MRYCGREFSKEELHWVSRLIETTPTIGRVELSQRFCKYAGWLKPDGGLKEMSCRVAFLRMERDGLLRLPPRKSVLPSSHFKSRQSPLTDPKPEINQGAGEFKLCFELVTKKTSILWNEFIDRYHYLGYTPLPGAQLRYFVKSQESILSLLGFGAAAWKTAPRDEYIGWSAEQRKKNLHLVVNNARFLLLPWVHSKYLASRILSMAVKRLPDDWQERYNYRPVLLETFVEKERFRGTCYKAAGWLCVGETKGRGKLDVRNEYLLPVKTVWLYPLAKDFRTHLFGDKA